MNVHEIVKAVSWLGFTAPAHKVMKICKKVDIDGSGELDEGEFLMCLRQGHEDEMKKTRQLFNEMDFDSSGRIDRIELNDILRLLDYKYASEEAIAEVYTDIGLSNACDLNISDFENFLLAYRFREGFTTSVAREFEEALDAFGRGVAGEVSSLEAIRVIRGLGFATSWDLHQLLVAEIDIDQSCSLQVTEMRKLVRRYHERAMSKFENAFKNFDSDEDEFLSQDGARAALTSCICTVEEEPDWEDDIVEVKEFMKIAVDLSWRVRHRAKSNHGFQEAEVNTLQKHYDKYNGHTGLCPEGVKALIQELYPDVWWSSQAREGLVDVIEPYVGEKAAPLDFDSFLRLARHCRDLQEQEMS